MFPKMTFSVVIFLPSLPLFEELLFPLPLLSVDLSQKSMFVLFTLQNLLFILPHYVSVLSVDESHDYLSVIFRQPAFFSDQINSVKFEVFAQKTYLLEDLMNEVFWLVTFFLFNANQPKISSA